MEKLVVETFLVPSAVSEETKALHSGGALELFLKNKLKKKNDPINKGVLTLIEPRQRTRLSLLNVFENLHVCLIILS